MEKDLSPSIKFIQSTKVENELFELYRDLRRELKKGGLKEDELTSVSEAPVTVWHAHGKLLKKFEEVRNLVTKYGLDDSHLGPYIENKFGEINLEIPLD
jgi:hypothetical protein